MAARKRTRIALIGSGFIADVHVQALASVPGVEVAALVDPVLSRAQALARRHGIARAFASVAELLAADVADAAHVLVPPGLHFPVARQCLQGGLHTLIEKPMALCIEHVEALAQLAKERGLCLAVNHNQACNPAVVRLSDHLAAGRAGRIEHVAVMHNVPLRQLQTGDVSHFMFQSGANILYEQGVHLFSIVHRLLGECRAVQAVTGPGRMLPNGLRFLDEWNLSLRCERGTATVRMAFGRTMNEATLHAVCSDGSAFLDLLRNACWLRRKSRWLDFLDQGRNLAAGGLHLLRRAWSGVVGYGLALFRLRRSDDPFLLGMRQSLLEFHEALAQGRTPANGPAAALAVLRMCEMAAEAAGVDATPAPVAPELPAPGAARPGETVVLGGAGFLGQLCVQRLLAMGKPVSLLVRRPTLLPAELRDPRLRIFVGDAADPASLAACMRGADCVLHLATVAGSDPAGVERAMAQAVDAAAAAAQEAGVRRFVYASSTAALYLGDPQPVVGMDGPDPRPQARGPYSRGKIAAERALAQRAKAGLDVVVVRPAVVLGGPAGLEHSGLGMWVRDNHCVGWGRGDVALPLVLGEDCAMGLVSALFAPAAAGKSYNLAGPVRLTAREFVQEMRLRTGRDYCFHPTPVTWMWLQEMGKHFVKFLARKPRELPSLRDLRSRAFVAPLDCSDAVRDLGFLPEADRARFLQRLFQPAPKEPKGSSSPDQPAVAAR